MLRSRFWVGLLVSTLSACGDEPPRDSSLPGDGGSHEGGPDDAAAPAPLDASMEAEAACEGATSCCAESKKFPRYPDRDDDGLGAREAPMPACREDPAFADTPADGDDNCPSNKHDLCGVCDGDGLGCGVVEMMAWEAASCILNSLGTVQCRGAVLGGLAGGGEKCGNHTCTSTPAQVQGVTGAKKLSAAPGCALDAEGRVTCWGPGRVEYNYVPGDPFWADGKQIAGLTGVSAVAVEPNSGNACAVMGDGSVRCWGDNSSNNLGDGLPHTDASCPDTWQGRCSRTPVPVPALSDVRGVAVWRYRVCAWTHAGKLFCWGRLGEALWQAPTGITPTPVEITGIGHVDQLVFGEAHGCALAEGKVFCFGASRYGALAEAPTSLNVQHAPKQVQGLPAIAQLAAWNDTTCARSEAGDVYCWGDARYLIMGANAMPQKCVAENDCVLAPTQVAGVKDATSLSLSYNHACVLNKAKQVWCWGSNFLMGLGVKEAPQMCANQAGGCSATPLRVF
jgi:hypothetical protein